MKLDFINDREKIKNILQTEEYGFLPKLPKMVWAEQIKSSDADKVFCAGKAPIERFILHAQTGAGEVQFPFSVCLPQKTAKKKVVVFLSFDKEIPNKYLPAEELIDSAWGFACIHYESVTSDTPEIDENARILSAGEKERVGKLMVWAWSAMRVADYLLTREDIDCKNLAIAGHSRLGKTALIVGAFDSRFAFVHSNCSGVAGASLYSMHEEQHEDIKILAEIRPYWFSQKYQSYVGKERELPFDQHYLMGLIAPRVLSVGSAEKDIRANPQGELEGARAASAAWERLGKTGLIAPNSAKVGENYHEGNVGYYMREGRHYFSREDWQRALSFFDKHLN